MQNICVCISVHQKCVACLTILKIVLNIYFFNTESEIIRFFPLHAMNLALKLIKFETR